METLSLQLVRKLFKFLVLTVPMRNGNHENHEKTNHLHTVLTVPMRNGNSLRALSCTISIESSYRTYEEWKQKGFITGESEIPLVLTVPMRNGNFLNVDFLSWTQRVLTVPMRNGNTDYNQIPLWLWEFLPYLWGMETLTTWQCRCWRCKFLPYLWGMETFWIWIFFHELKGSYRTYEEWKPVCCSRPCFSNSGSYRTYEEWKRYTHIIAHTPGFYVLTVPMRNGNTRKNVYWHFFLIVLTVPMRNGNTDNLTMSLLEM